VNLKLRKTFHQELDNLRKEITRMGQLVQKAIANALKALIEGDLDLAAKVVAGDDQVDQINLAIERQSVSLVARQCPVAGDLRFIHTILFISIHLERMGDLSLNLAKTTRYIINEESVPSLFNLLSRMGEQTQLVTKTALEAFSNNDVELARSLPALDDPIDDIFKQFFKEVANITAEKGSFDWASNMVLSSRYLERIADHAVDIGELITYMVTGKVEHFN
jgi:phosphate transport system protein